MLRTPPAHRRAGNGEPVLLLHGITQNWKCWEPVIGQLASEFDVFAPTLPGHFGGLEFTSAPSVPAIVDAVADLMDEIGWPTAHIVGNSLGGWIAFELAARGRASTVTAIAPGGLWTAGSRHQRSAQLRLRMLVRAAPLLPLALLPGGKALAQRVMRAGMGYDCSRVGAEVIRDILEPVARCTCLSTLIESREFRSGTTAHLRSSTPTAILFGEQDRLIPPALYADLPTRPGLVVRTLPGVGHMPMGEDPDLVAGEIRRHIRESGTTVRTG